MLRPFALVLLLLAPLLGGCRYNFVPLVPKPVSFQLPVRIVAASLERTGEELIVKARLEGKYEPGYLTVNWFDNSRPLGSDSVYVDAAMQEATFRLSAPEQGAYRATLSFGGNVLRQVELYEVEP